MITYLGYSSGVMLKNYMELSMNRWNIFRGPQFYTWSTSFEGRQMSDSKMLRELSWFSVKFLKRTLDLTNLNAFSYFAILLIKMQGNPFLHVLPSFVP